MVIGGPIKLPKVKLPPNPFVGLGHEGSGLLDNPKPPAPPAPPAAPPTTAATPPPINWAAILGLDPGYTQAQGAADANIKNSLINYGAGTLDATTLAALQAAGFNVDQGTLAAAQNNPYSTTKQLTQGLHQNIRANSQNANHHGTLFSGSTVQGAENAQKATDQSRYNATQTLLGLIGQAQASKASALSEAQQRIIANPALYGLPTTGGDSNTASTPTTPTVKNPGYSAPPKVTVAQIKKDPLAGQKAKNRF